MVLSFSTRFMQMGKKRRSSSAVEDFEELGNNRRTGRFVDRDTCYLLTRQE